MNITFKHDISTMNFQKAL